MKDKIELVKAWIEKADICFHAQQCAEKYLKAYLTYKEVEFRKIHDLGKPIGLASKIDKDFMDIEESTFEEAQEAIEMAEKIAS